ncbi:MAG: hypothetical protein H6907_14385 [Hyphomicrobiales bacterium]|nr:hypothetical protein [Hyphomicrobiales bacterium]
MRTKACLKMGAAALFFLVAACNATTETKGSKRSPDAHYYGSGHCCDYTP